MFKSNLHHAMVGSKFVKFCIPYAAAMEKEPVFANPANRSVASFRCIPWLEAFGQGTWLISQKNALEFEAEIEDVTKEPVIHMDVEFPFGQGRGECLVTDLGVVYIVDHARYMSKFFANSSPLNDSPLTGFWVPDLEFLIQSYEDKDIFPVVPEKHLEILKSYLKQRG